MLPRRPIATYLFSEASVLTFCLSHPDESRVAQARRSNGVRRRKSGYHHRFPHGYSEPGTTPLHFFDEDDEERFGAGLVVPGLKLSILRFPPKNSSGRLLVLRPRFPKAKRAWDGIDPIARVITNVGDTAVK